MKDKNRSSHIVDKKQTKHRHRPIPVTYVYSFSEMVTSGLLKSVSFTSTRGRHRVDKSVGDEGESWRD
jgi:hypothetical protein